MIENAKRFNDDLISEHNKNAIEGFDPSIIQPPEHLHLTILMLKLFTDEQVKKNQYHSILPLHHSIHLNISLFSTPTSSADGPLGRQGEECVERDYSTCV